MKRHSNDSAALSANARSAIGFLNQPRSLLTAVETPDVADDGFDDLMTEMVDQLDPEDRRDLLDRASHGFLVHRAPSGYALASMGRRGAWVSLTAGALLLIAAVAGFVIAGGHRPVYTSGLEVCEGTNSGGRCGGWTTTPYDVVRIATWACLIVGLILVLVGLIRTWRSASL